ncbi:error-prone DNA polymerase [Diaphorobacter caeni]|uniref:error-prone DNA polymerase n=1 Tax=Diaphorobacter caeni TaxID=2784387 RepID=UPI001E5F464B|nr:error-prone DNA polymerase [Diaphorobacter caeni]
MARKITETAPPTLALPGYAELHCLSNFSFQRGASHPGELVERAEQLGYAALAITDECSVAGVVRAWLAVRHQAAKRKEAQERGEALRDFELPLLYGSEFQFGDLCIVAIARDLQGWGDLCEFITAARGAALKGSYRLTSESPWRLLHGCELLIAPHRAAFMKEDEGVACLVQALESARAMLGCDFSIAVELHKGSGDSLWLQMLQQAGAQLNVPLVAAGGVLMHSRMRKPLLDVITAVGMNCSVAECGHALESNGERRLRSRAQLARIYAPRLLAATVAMAGRCHFKLDQIRYNYPLETVPSGKTAMQRLGELAWEGVREKYPNGGMPEWLRGQIHKELDLISEQGYEMYFLTVHDIVRQARKLGILCQGRGSAANSVICYFLGITAVNPEVGTLLFERFISKERKEPPDIDVDFEHERREEVIQYIYDKYGHDRAAITAVVITYRLRSALRDVGKALGVAPALVDAFAKDHHWFDDAAAEDRLLGLARDVGEDISAHTAHWWFRLTRELHGFPRHLSQHVGGFVLTQDKLTRLVPVEPASMAKRTIIQWDKDDLDALNLLKVDVLALGMLTALRRCLDMRNAIRERPWTLLSEIPREDSATYDMICAADTIGTFQIESRAQMSMLPRLLPRTFYDLVVEVAIVRPGPIQGGMVHPYLLARERQRKGQELRLEKPALKPALERTLGIPIFQEQVMQIAMAAAGFSPAEADALRRSMAAWKRHGGVHHFRDRVIGGMVKNGYREAFAEQIFQQMLGFGEYGFPESHAYSFAMLAYASAWFKRHEPACFLAALLNSQPMGFYTPSQLVQDARRHGVRVLPVDVTRSDRLSTLEAPLQPMRGVAQPQPAVRLGLHLVAHLETSAAQRLLQARAQAPFESTQDLALRAQLDRHDLQALAAADALTSLSGHRRQQMWEAAAQWRAPPLLRETPTHEDRLELPQAKEGEAILFDYSATGLTLRNHPLTLLRARLDRWKIRTAAQLLDMPNGRRVRAAGIVTVRQRPGTAKGTMFVSLEDETGTVNVVVWPSMLEKWRDTLLRARLLAVEGLWQCSRPNESAPQHATRHLIVERVKDLTPLLGRLGAVLNGSRDFH